MPGNLQAFRARLETARRAGRSLDIQYYYWKNDLTGRLLLNEIIAAAERGVRVQAAARRHQFVRLRFDLSGARQPSQYRGPPVQSQPQPRRFVQAGAGTHREVFHRHPAHAQQMLDRRWPRADRRRAQHRGRLLRCLRGCQFPGHRRSGHRRLRRGGSTGLRPLLEQRACTAHKIAAQVQAGQAHAHDQQARRVLRHRAGANPALSGRRPRGTCFRPRCRWTRFHWSHDVELVADPPEKASGEAQPEWLGKRINTLLASAQNSLRIISPYFIPGEAGAKTLIAAAERGVDVRVLTNSLAATDVIAVHGAYARYRRMLLGHGIYHPRTEAGARAPTRFTVRFTDGQPSHQGFPCRWRDVLCRLLQPRSALALDQYGDGAVVQMPQARPPVACDL